MKFKKSVLYIFVIFMFFGGAPWAIGATCWVTPISWPNGAETVNVYSYYSNYSGAATAANALKSSLGVNWILTGTLTFATYKFGYPGSCTSDWQGISVYKNDGTCRYIIFYPNGGVLPSGTPCTYLNRDGDSIPNTLDPYPDSAEPFQYNLLVTFRDSSDNPIGYLVELDDGTEFYMGTTGFMNTIESGIDPFDSYAHRININVGEEYQFDQTDYAALVSASGATESQSSAGTFNTFDFDADGNIETSDVSGNFENGTVSGGTETDNEALRQIQTNTANVASNQAEQASQLERIAVASEQMLRNAAAAGVITYGGPSASEIGSAVADAVGGGSSEYGGPSAGDIATAIDVNDDSRLTSETDSATSAAGSGVTGMQTDVDGFSTAMNGSGMELNVDDLGAEYQNQDLSDSLDDLLTGNDYSSALSGSGLSYVNPVCSLSCNLTMLGQQQYINFSLCEYESQIEAMGLILLGLAGIFALMIVVGV